MKHGREALFALVFLSGCSAHAVTTAHADHIVAVPGPAAGRFQAAAEEIRRGVERKIAEINASGGIEGERLAILTVDDDCSQAGGKAAAERVLAARPAVVIGHPCASAATSAADLYAKAELIFIAPAVRHPALTAGRKHSTIFRYAGRDDRQGEDAARWLLANAPAKRIAIVHDRTAFARSIAEPAKNALASSGLKDFPYLTIVAGRRDYPEIAAALKSAGSEAVFFAGYPDEAAIILANLRREGLTAAFLGTDSTAAPAFAAAASRDSGIVRALLPANPATRLDERAEAALEAWAAAVRTTKTTAGPNVAAALRSGTSNATSSPIIFDEAGDALTPSFNAARPLEAGWHAETWSYGQQPGPEGLTGPATR